jgi:glyoxylase-like metal-dependent hydrolase (beta-lactamase superfamily II)
MGFESVGSGVIALTSDIALVGGGPVAGAGLTDGGDAHVYLLDGGDAFALVDCGMGLDRSFDQIAASVEAAGHRLSSGGRLLLTHGHADHAGGAARFRAEGLTVHASVDIAVAMAIGDADALGLNAGKAAGIFPADYELAPCTVDQIVQSDDVITVGRLRVAVIPTPGHSAGHTAYMVDGPNGRALLAGDSVFMFGRVLLQAVSDADLQATITSLRTLGALSFDAFLPGHGGFSISGGPAHVAMAVAHLDGLRLPPNLV